MVQRLTAIDSSFLWLERPNVHMHVAGLMILDPSTRPDGNLSFEALQEMIARRIHLVPRFRQRVAFIPFRFGRPNWVDDPTFDLSFHMRRAALPAPGGRRELADFVQRVHSRPLDRSKPLWELYLIEGLESGHVAVLTKSHHAMIDGMSGMDLATVLFDVTPEPREVEPAEWWPAPLPSALSLLRTTLVDSITHPVQAAVQSASAALVAPRAALDRARQIAGGFGSLLGAGSTPRAPLAGPSPFNITVGPNRRLGLAEVPVADAKAIKNALGGTVNDVVLAGVAGAVGRLLEARGRPTEGLTLRAMIPVSTRDESQRMAMGNRISMFFADLPVGPMDPAERLHTITASTRDLKDSHQALGAAAIMGAARWAPATLHALASRLVARQRFANMVVSNVPGPQMPLYLAGARLVSTYPVMPLGETIALSIGITSLSGVMGFGFTTDWDAVPDVDLLGEGLLATIEEMKKAAGA